jgi:uncharacterized protein YbbK (DUF523 family)
VLNHPRGLLNRSHATLDGFVDAHTEAEAAVVEAREDQMFQEWIDTIYARYSREELNHFEHNVQVRRFSVCSRCPSCGDCFADSAGSCDRFGGSFGA